MRASCYWKWIRGDLHSEGRSREPKLESGGAVTDKRERWQGEKQGYGGGEEDGGCCRAGFVCVSARGKGQTDGERRDRLQPQNERAGGGETREPLRQMILLWPSEVLEAEPKADETTVVRGVAAEDRRAADPPPSRRQKWRLTAWRMISGGGERKSGGRGERGVGKEGSKITGFTSDRGVNFPAVMHSGQRPRSDFFKFKI